MEQEQKRIVEYEAIEPTVWKPEKEGDFIEGVLVEKREAVGTFESKAYMLENKEGQFLVWGTTVLDDRMNFIKIEEQIKIEFKGTQKNTKGQEVKIYKVYREKIKQ